MNDLKDDEVDIITVRFAWNDEIYEVRVEAYRHKPQPLIDRIYLWLDEEFPGSDYVEHFLPGEL